jgi:hypothetical protein
LVTFSLAKQEKVTSCRATPGGFDFEFEVGFGGMARSYKSWIPACAGMTATLQQVQGEGL